MRTLALLLSFAVAMGAQSTMTSTLTITSANNGRVYDNMRISTITGPCVILNGASNVTIQNSNIGPCGQNNSDADSNGIEVNGGTGNKIYDSYIHVQNRALTNSFSSTASHAGVQGNGTANLDVQGNVVCYGSANVRAFKSGSTPSTGWTVTGNYLCNPRGYDGSGNNFQAVDSYSMTVSNNYAYSCVLGGSGTQIMCPTSPVYLFTQNQEDSINFFYHSQPPSNSGTVSNNYVVGGESHSGDGIIADQFTKGENVQINTVINTGQVGIGFDDGINNTMNGNKVWMSNPVTINNTAMAVHEEYAGPCSGDVITNNIARQVGGSNGSDFFNGSPSCITTNSGNTFGTAAETALGLSGAATWATIQTKLPPPLIPPVPKNCTVNSPYTTQASLPRCGAAISSPTITSFTATPSTPIVPGASVTLAWTSTGGTSATLNGSPVALSGTQIVSPLTTTAYLLVVSNSAGAPSQTVTVTVGALPVISSFTASPSTIALGSSSTLALASTGGASCSINQGVGTVACNSSTSVSPLTSKLYTVTVTNSFGNVTAQVLVGVSISALVGASVINGQVVIH